MATKKTAFVDVNFSITVRVPVDYNDLPDMCNKEGESLDATVTDKVWNRIVSSAVEAMDGPTGTDVKSITVAEIVEDDDPDNGPDEDEFYNSPEYIHDAALDWLYDNYTEMSEASDDEMKDAVADYLRQEGYDVDDVEADMAIEDAIADFCDSVDNQ